jgi:hypothetical protein
MRDLQPIQASPVTLSEANLSLTELGRIVAAQFGWKLDSDWKICEPGQPFDVIGDITSVSDAMRALGWIVWEPPREGSLRVSRSHVQWATFDDLAPIEDEFHHYHAVVLRDCIAVAEVTGWSEAIRLYDLTHDVVLSQEAFRTNMDDDLIRSVMDGRKR